MVIEIRETVYKGFRINHAEEDGWEIILDGEKVWFPHLTAAQSAVDEFYGQVVPKHTEYKHIRKRKGERR